MRDVSSIVAKKQAEYKALFRDILRDVIDLHVHVAPEWMPRRQDCIEVALDARDAGMRALVYKPLGSFPTMGLAYAAEKAVPDIKVFGGLVLDYPVGGLNPMAVNKAIEMDAKVIWMPTMNAANLTEKIKKGVSTYYSQYGYTKASELKEGLRVAVGGKLVPAADEILNIIAEKKDVILATGHISPEESLVLIDEARGRGIEKILVTHVSGPIIGATDEQMREMAKKGAYLEEVFSFCLPFYDRQSPQEIVTAIKSLDAKHFCLSSDLGSYMNPPPVEGFKLFIITLMELGITEQEIGKMIRENPASLLGLA